MMVNNTYMIGGMRVTRWAWEIIISEQQSHGGNSQTATTTTPLSAQIRAVGPAAAMAPPADIDRSAAAGHDLPPSYESLFGILPSYAAALQHAKQQAQGANTRPAATQQHLAGHTEATRL